MSEMRAKRTSRRWSAVSSAITSRRVVAQAVEVRARGKYRGKNCYIFPVYRRARLFTRASIAQTDEKYLDTTEKRNLIRTFEALDAAIARLLDPRSIVSKAT